MAYQSYRSYSPLFIRKLKGLILNSLLGGWEKHHIDSSIFTHATIPRYSKDPVKDLRLRITIFIIRRKSREIALTFYAALVLILAIVFSGPTKNLPSSFAPIMNILSISSLTSGLTQGAQELAGEAKSSSRSLLSTSLDLQSKSTLRPPLLYNPVVFSSALKESGIEKTPAAFVDVLRNKTDGGANEKRFNALQAKILDTRVIDEEGLENWDEDDYKDASEEAWVTFQVIAEMNSSAPNFDPIFADFDKQRPVVLLPKHLLRKHVQGN